MVSIIDVDKLVEFAKSYLEKNEFRVAQTKRVFKLAKQNFRAKPELQELTFTSIILHDISGSTVKDQYEKVQQISAAILEKFGCPNLFFKQVCEIIGTQHEPLGNPSEPFKKLYDFDKLVMFSTEEYRHYNPSKGFDWSGIITLLYEKQAKQLAENLLAQRKKGQG